MKRKNLAEKNIALLREVRCDHVSQMKQIYTLE